MKLIWKSSAISDRRKIMEYIAQDSPSAAVKINQIFKEKAELARANPTLYRSGRKKGTRELVVSASYVMIYKVDKINKSVIILRILHTAQQFPESS